MPLAERTGDNLRGWLGLDRARCYDPEILAILPLGLLYPGRGAGGDRLPRPECAPRWQARLRAPMPEIRLTPLFGGHGQAHHLGARGGASLAATVRALRAYLPGRFPLPHASPRNAAWLIRHPWFEDDVLPAPRAAVAPPEHYSAALGSLRRCFR